MDNEITLQYIKEKGLTPYQIFHLIKEKSPEEIKKYITPEQIKDFGLPMGMIRDLMIATGEPERYLTPEAIMEYNLNSITISKLINATGNVDKYLLDNQEEIIFDENFMCGDERFIVNAIKSTGRIEKYLSIENVKKFNLESEDICNLIIQIKKAEEYLTLEQIQKYGLDSYDVCKLIKSTQNIEQYMEPEKIKVFELNDQNIAELIISIGKAEEYLTRDNIEKYGLNNGIGSGIKDLILATHNVDKYLTLENIKEFGGMSRGIIDSLIRRSGKKEEYLLEGQKLDKNFKFSILNVIKHSGKDVEEFIRNEEYIDNYSLSFEDIKNALPKDYFSEKESEILADFNSESIQSVINATEEDRIKIIEILDRLNKSNSGELRKIKSKIAVQILQNSDQYEETISRIEQIYLTKNVPEVGKRFLVFKELHPNFLGENTKLARDESMGNIPSLNSMTEQERNHTIFSDLLRCSIESYDRDLKHYLDVIEEGDILYNQVISGNLDIHKLPEEGFEYQALKKYSSILNTLYNLTSKGKRADKKRTNLDDLEEDLIELDELFKNDENIHLNLPDRIVRSFGYWAGITSMEQIKLMIQNTRDNAHNRNIAMVINGNFTLEEGDFIKGIKDTSFFPMMLQNGIVAKDYLGESSSHDMTPLDTDVWKIIKKGESLKETLKEIKGISNYVNKNHSDKSLGKIILAFDGTDYIETKNENREINQDGVSQCKEFKDKKECFFNWNNIIGNQAYGIRTGVGTTNIKYIISDIYVEKLGLEIALNGFYIPVINEDGKVLYTPEMYKEFRDKMQGLSYYGEKIFELDETAKNSQTQKIIDYIELNKIKSENKRNKILDVFRRVAEKMGLKLSDKRNYDLTPGIVEFIDTGSTGRGTNEPGDGDFDFMVRMDLNLYEDSEKFKQLIKDELNMTDKIEKSNETGNGDFRYKGVTIDGLKEKVDLDLTFSMRSNEIEYSTEECINDRLKTIENNNKDDYKYVIANILLSKKFLKNSNVYKKANAPAPQKGESDTRGGLGAVGIENWILQNGGSFEKASRGFLKEAGVINDEGDLAEKPKNVPFEEFKKKYFIWDFGENWTSSEKEIYAHDNFVNNMTEEGYQKMIMALKEYIQHLETIKESTAQNDKIGISDFIKQDMSVIEDTMYMKSVRTILGKSKAMEKEENIK